MKTFCHIKPILSFIGICSFAAYRGMAYAHCPMSDQINVGPSGVAFATADDESEFFLISRSDFYAVDSKNGESTANIKFEIAVLNSCPSCLLYSMTECKKFQRALEDAQVISSEGLYQVGKLPPKYAGES